MGPEMMECTYSSLSYPRLAQAKPLGLAAASMLNVNSAAG